MSQVINWLRSSGVIMVHHTADIADREISSPKQWQTPDLNQLLADDWWSQAPSYEQHGWFTQTQDSDPKWSHSYSVDTDEVLDLDKPKNFLNMMFSDLSALPNTLTIVFWCRDEEGYTDWESRYSFFNLDKGN